MDNKVGGDSHYNIDGGSKSVVNFRSDLLHNVGTSDVMNLDEMMASQRKKLTPKRKGQPSRTPPKTPPSVSQLHFETETTEPDSPPKTPPSLSSSTFSDDSAEDENYKIDPRDLIESDLELVSPNVKKLMKDKGLKKPTYHSNDEKDDECGSDGENEDHANEFEGKEYHWESDDSLILDDILREEFHYDDDELISMRENSLLKKKKHFGSKWTGNMDEHNQGGSEGNNEDVSGQQTHENNHQVEQNVQQTSERTSWPSFWTTYQGGYDSDQRDSDNEDPFSSDGEHADFDVDVERGNLQKRKKSVKYPVFNEKTEMRIVELSVGLKFTSIDIFKQAIVAYSIQQQKDLVYMKNDKRFISIGCANCRWELTSGPDIDDTTGWQIKSLQPLHERCTRTFHNRLITVNWLVNEYLDKILRNPLMKAQEMKDDMRARYDIIVGIRQCQRAKCKALNAVVSLMKKQYGILKPYLVELKHQEASTWARGRKKGSKNRVGRSISELVEQGVPTPTDYVKKARKSAKKSSEPTTTTTSTSQPWLEATTGRGRGRKKGRGGRTIPLGVGIYCATDGAIQFSGSTSSPPVVLSQGQFSSQPTCSS
ncbi:hypothetical protein BVRB_9g211180 [Beta vulgaris subsp. vulgaris]|nr:hypothetical protein BVRB_9g211180 [Beta vulgaris subsp. vulgaris]